MEMKVEILPKSRIAYIRNIGPYGYANKQTMENLKKWAKDNDLFNKESIIFGIAQDNPAITLPEKCRYDACIVISDNYKIDNAVSESVIDGGKYAIFKINHTSKGVSKAWNEVFNYLYESGYSIDNGKPIIERYLKNLVDDGYCEICVPIL